MRKAKTNNKYYFKDDQEVIDMLKQYPVGFSEHAYLVDKIHERYPMIDKVKIALILIKCLDLLRILFIFGNIFSFNKLFFDFKMHVYKRKIKEVIVTYLRVKITTPPGIK